LTSPRTHSRPPRSLTSPPPSLSPTIRIPCSRSPVPP
jgi:hypothetical protein